MNKTRYQPPDMRLRPRGGRWVECELNARLDGEWIRIPATCWEPAEDVA